MATTPLTRKLCRRVDFGPVPNSEFGFLLNRPSDSWTKVRNDLPSLKAEASIIDSAEKPRFDEKPGGAVLAAPEGLWRMRRLWEPQATPHCDPAEGRFINKTVYHYSMCSGWLWATRYRLTPIRRVLWKTDLNGFFLSARVLQYPGSLLARLSTITLESELETRGLMFDA